MNPLLRQLQIPLPIIQAPMAGVSTPAMAAAVSNAGGLGSIGIGNLTADVARQQIRQVRQLTDRPFNVNVFCHQPAVADPQKESDWLKFLTPHFERFGAQPPDRLRESYTSFLADEAMQAMLLAERPAVVSLHFGLPSTECIAALKEAGIILLATATCLAEAHQIQAAGLDAVIAQGFEAGGHRGTFDFTQTATDNRQSATDNCVTTLALTRQLATTLSLPVIAAGGIMDGAGIAASLLLGASAAQLGTAFILCPESAADSAYRAALQSAAAEHTRVTAVISGRPARSLPNHFTTLEESTTPAAIPAYPIAYDAAKALISAAKSQGETGYAVQWAGQGAPQARALPAAELVERLQEELEAALAGRTSQS